MNGVCMDTNLIVITNINWVIDGLLALRRKYSVYIQDENKFNSI
jgi:hypothetical protein